jgi:uncharacterized protein (TIGR02147 family)
MVSVFDYRDLRRYLRDWLADRKRHGEAVSYQALSQRSGLANKGYLYQVIHSGKALSADNARRLSRALAHNRFEAEYFETLTALGSARTAGVRRQLEERLELLKQQGAGYAGARLLAPDQYEYFATWYHSAVRSLIGMRRFRGDFSALGRMVYPPISARQARASVRLLEKLGLVERSRAGVYRLAEASITTGSEVSAAAVRSFHIECGRLAQQATVRLPREERNVTGLTLGISRRTYERICEEIQAFQRKLADFATRDKAADRVYQMNFQLFPMSVQASERKKR